jgi:hypothetical protein
LVTREPTDLWEIHLRIPEHGPVAVACKHGGASVTDGVARVSTPTETLRMLEDLLQQCDDGEQLFITARTHDSALSMWRTSSKAAGLYWCASALAKLWRQAAHSVHGLEPVPLRSTGRPGLT